MPQEHITIYGLVASLVGEETHRSPMDIDGTGSVNILDLVLVATASTHPTCSYTQLSEDVNSDGVVNILDLTLVASNIGESGTHAADVNGDCEVNTADLLLVASAFGNTVASSEDAEE